MKCNKIIKRLSMFGLILVTSTISFGQTQNAKEKNQKEQTVEEVFKARDKNEDGKLSKDELIGFVSNDFTKLDSDKDGFLSLEELAKSSKFEKKTKRPDNMKGERPSITELFSQMDANKDGKLSKDEVKGPLVDDFAKIDSNKDGFLTKEELEKVPKPEGKQGKNGPSQGRPRQ